MFAFAAVRRDTWVISLIGLMHGLSHFYQLALPAVFLAVRDDLGISFSALGLLASAFYVVSGLCQTFAGFAVDRFGAHRVLFAGLAMMAGGTALMGLANSYAALFACTLLMGVGNSVFHPADFGVLNANVDAKRLGPAYSVHGLTGNLGWAVAPATMTALTIAFDGWRGGLVAAGLAGLVVLACVATRRDLLSSATAPSGAVKSAAPAAGAAILLSRPILGCFLFFMLFSSGLIGVQTFGIPTLHQSFAMPQQLATMTVTCFLLGGAAGILCGGFVAMRARRHDLVAVIGMCVAAGLMGVIGAGLLPAAGILVALTAAGFFSGLTNPSRDMLVRAATPPGSTGKVYGFVYSGLDAGSALAPLMFGWFLDHGRGELSFQGVALVWLAGVAAIALMRTRPPGVCARTGVRRED